ncbi:MAG: ferredoxin-thioredoxin reductase catalytic domain-containing protein [Candidatus Nanoarchaeia archaeon]
MDKELITQQEIEKEIEIWSRFASQFPEKISLQPDQKRLELLARGVLTNQKNTGYKFCPCRIISKDMKEDIKLLCPCNFRLQNSWKEKGECWCGLFIKNKN